MAENTKADIHELVEALEWALAELDKRTRYTGPHQRQNCFDKCEAIISKHREAL